MSRRVHKATDELPDEALRVMTGGFRCGKTYAAIARDLAEIDVTVAERTVARRGSEWRMQQERRRQASEYIHDLVGAMKSQDLNAVEMGEALMRQALMDDPEAFAGADPIRMQRLSIQTETLRLKQRELDIRARLVAAEEDRLRLLTAREERAKDALAKSDVPMTPEERLAEIRSIYGIAPAPAQEANG